MKWKYVDKNGLGRVDCQCLYCRSGRGEVFSSRKLDNTLCMDVIHELGIVEL